MDESDVVNYPPYLYFKLVSNFLPDPEKSAEIIEYYESRRQGTETLKSPKALVENEFVTELKLPNGASAVILAVDDTYRELERLIFETIQSYQPENIFLPLCEERKASLFITEKEDREILEFRIKKIQELQIKQKLEGTDEKILLQKKVDDDRLQNRLYPNREIRAVFQAARYLNGCVLHFSEPKVSEVYSRLGKISPEELQKFDVYTRSRILDLDSWKKTKSPQFRDFLASKRLEVFPNINDVYYAKRADYITKKVLEVASQRSLILVDIELYDEICAKLKDRFQ